MGWYIIFLNLTAVRFSVPKILLNQILHPESFAKTLPGFFVADTMPRAIILAHGCLDRSDR